VNTLFHKPKHELWFSPVNEVQLKIDYDLLESPRCLSGCGGKKTIGRPVCDRCARFLGVEGMKKLEAIQPGDGLETEVSRLFAGRSM